jgi:hypothetical protein
MQPLKVPQIVFEEELIELYDLCSFGIRKSTPELYYKKFGHKYTTGEMRAGFKRLEDAPPPKLNKYVIETSIKECLKTKKVEGRKIGCNYCDPVGLIQYYKIINGLSYSFSAQCHICRTSPYINEPFYNELFPHDNIKPHSTLEQMKDKKKNVDEHVKMLTGREHENYGEERKRERIMFKERQIEQGVL